MVQSQLGKERGVAVEEKTAPYEGASSIFLLNTRLLSQEWISQRNIECLTDIPDTYWSTTLAGFTDVYMLGIYGESRAGKDSARKYLHEYRADLPEMTLEDVVSSPFAIPSYERVHPNIARSWTDWEQFYHRLHRLGKRVILDMVPNHTSLDSDFLFSHPDFLIRAPDWYRDAVETPYGRFANGKDPYFGSYADTLQLNYGQSGLHEEMIRTMKFLSRYTDGFRCDMSMLVQPQIFTRIWGHLLSDQERSFANSHSFWDTAISEVKSYAMQQLGKKMDFIAEFYEYPELYGESKNDMARVFDSLYAKDLYDHLLRIVRGDREVSVRTLADHIRGIAASNVSFTTFIENHDEWRAKAMFGDADLAALSVLIGVPNTKLIVHDGQREGRVHKIPMQIGRYPREETLDLYHARQVDWLVDFRSQILPQLVTYAVPDAWDMSLNVHQTIFVQELVTQSQRILICTNLGHERTKAFVPSHGANDRHVFDVSKLDDLAEIASPDDSGHLYVELEGFGVQIIIEEVGLGTSNQVF